jgi:hypothetical protein
VICLPGAPDGGERLLIVTGGFNVTVAEALLVLSAALVAVTVTVCWLAMVAGAVYKPELLMVPVAGLKLHVTAVLLVFPTVATNCCACEAASETVNGVTLTVTGGTNVTDTAISTPQQITGALRAARSKGTASVTVVRGKKEMPLNVTIQPGVNRGGVWGPDGNLGNWFVYQDGDGAANDKLLLQFFRNDGQRPSRIIWQ